jgi:hypothetical protein
MRRRTRRIIRCRANSNQCGQPMPELDREIFKPGRYRIGDMINLCCARARCRTDE